MSIFFALYPLFCYQPEMALKPAKKQTGWRGSREFWLQGAYQMLVEAGAGSIRVSALADKLEISRTSFYWHFDDRKSLLDALIKCWQEKNTGNLVSQTKVYSETITEAILHLFDCWINTDLFDSDMDFAIRNWAHNSPDLKQILDQTDEERLNAIRDIFLRFGVEPQLADVRAHVIYYTQIGYISMMVKEPMAPRIEKMSAYVETFAGQPPTASELARFKDRHMRRLGLV